MRPARSSPAGPLRPTALLAVVLLVVGYTVERGDTLSELAERFDVAVDALTEANQLDDPDHLVAGTRVTVPRADPGADPGADGGHAGDGPEVDTTPEGDDATSAAPPGAEGRAQVGALLERTARAHGWSPAFVKAVAWQESGWNQDRVSSAGAVGIMQVMPATGEFVSSRLAGRPLDLDDPADNVLAGVLFLDHLYERTERDTEATLAGYYQGLASVREHGRYDDTERYIANVLALRERFR